MRQERVQRTAEWIVDVPVAQGVDAGASENDRMIAWSEVAGGAGATQMGAWSKVVRKSCNAGMDVAQERVGEDIVEVHVSPTERVQWRIVEHVVVSPVPQAVLEILGVVHFHSPGEHHEGHHRTECPRANACGEVDTT